QSDAGIVQETSSPEAPRNCRWTACWRGSRPANVPSGNVAWTRSLDLAGRKLDCVTVRGSQGSGGSVVVGDGATMVVVVVVGVVVGVGVTGVVVVVGTVEGGVVVVVVVARHVSAVPVQVPVPDSGAGPGAMSQGMKFTFDGTPSLTSSPGPS